MLNDEFVIRRYVGAAEVRLPEITALLHRAYAPLAQAGMRYLASHQDDATTRNRLLEGIALLAFLGDRLVGTVTFTPPGKKSRTPWYSRAAVARFGQLAVDPAVQRQGIGRRLMDAVEVLAIGAGAEEIACDTSEHAHDLIALYTRRGFRFVEHVQWKVTNYRSVILSKTLAHRG